VEIGVYAGRSAFAIGLGLEFVGEGELWGIDCWSPGPCGEGLEDGDANKEWWSQHALHEQIEKDCFRVRHELGLSSRVQLIKSTSRQAKERVEEWGPLDLLHIDGNHSEKVSCEDVEAYVPLLKSGGQLWFDDINWDTTKEAQKKVEGFCKVVRLEETYGVYEKF
jgi:predicted O-methyltransferase YrrM